MVEEKSRRANLGYRQFRGARLQRTDQEADHWANISAQGRRKIVFYRKDDPTTWEAIRGFVEEIPPLYLYCTQFWKHYGNDADELKRYGLFKISKARVTKLNALNPESVFGITSMSDKHVKSQETLHDVKRTDEMVCCPAT